MNHEIIKTIIIKKIKTILAVTYWYAPGGNWFTKNFSVGYSGLEQAHTVRKTDFSFEWFFSQVRRNPKITAYKFILTK